MVSTDVQESLGAQEVQGGGLPPARGTSRRWLAVAVVLVVALVAGWFLVGPGSSDSETPKTTVTTLLGEDPAAQVTASTVAVTTSVPATTVAPSVPPSTTTSTPTTAKPPAAQSTPARRATTTTITAPAPTVAPPTTQAAPTTTAPPPTVPPGASCIALGSEVPDC